MTLICQPSQFIILSSKVPVIDIYQSILLVSEERADVLGKSNHAIRDRSSYKDNLELKVIQQESGTDVTIQKDRVSSCRSHTFVEQLVSFTDRKRDNCQLYFGQPNLALNSLLLFVVADLTQG